MKKKSKLKQDYLRLLKKTSSEDLLKIQREIIDALRKYEAFELEIKKILLEGRRFIVKMQKELKGEFSKIDKNYPDPKYESLFGRDVTPRWEIENQQRKRIALKIKTINKSKNFFKFDKHEEVIETPKKIFDLKDKIIRTTNRQFHVFQKILPIKLNRPTWSNLDNPYSYRSPGFLSIKSFKDFEKFSITEEHFDSGSHLGIFDSKRTFEKILDEMPSLLKNAKETEQKQRVRKKRQDRSAKLAAYEDKSRNVGKTIMKKMKENASTPFYCPYCLEKTQKKDIHVDHINPVSNGGLSVESNLIPICKKCNLSKKDLPLRKFCKNEGYDFESICEILEKLGKFI